MKKSLQVLNKKIVFPNKWRRIDEYKVKTRAGEIENFYITVVPDTVMVFALTTDNRVVVNKQYDVLRGKRMFELPAGFMDKGKTALQTAKEELREETGYVAKKWKYIGYIYVERWNSSKMKLFVAIDATKVGTQQLESAEDILVETVPVSTFVELLSSGKIVNGPSALCGYKAVDYLKLV